MYRSAKEEYCSDGDEAPAHSWGVVRDLLDEIEGEIIADMVVTEGKRSDGRAALDIRQIDCEVGVLPRVHGSSLFQRRSIVPLTNKSLPLSATMRP